MNSSGVKLVTAVYIRAIVPTVTHIMPESFAQWRIMHMPAGHRATIHGRCSIYHQDAGRRPQVPYPTQTSPPKTISYSGLLRTSRTMVPR